MTRTAFVIAPALGIDSGYYQSLQRALQNELGASSMLAPLPTLGPRSAARLKSSSPGLDSFMLKIASTATTLRTEGAARVLLLGHSVGGQMGVAAAARWPDLFDGLVLVACGSPYWGAWPRQEQWRFRVGVGAIDVLTRLLPWYPGTLLGFGGNQPRQVMRDWVGMAQTGTYLHLSDGSRLEKSMRDLRLPALAINVPGDWLAPTCATDYLLAKLPALDVQRSTAGADALRGVSAKRKHFAWIRQPACVTSQINRWLNLVAFPSMK